MIRILNPRTDITTKAKISFANKLHAEKSNSLVENYSGVNINNNISSGNNNVVSTNDSITNTTDKDCEITFKESSLYSFLANELPEETIITEKKLKFINSLIHENILQGNVDPQLLYEEIGYSEFLEKLTNGDFNEVFFLADQFNDYYNSIISLYPTELRILGKDTNGSTFLGTNSFNRYDIEEGYASSVKCPINDSTSSEKDGFNINEIITLFLLNLNTSQELKLTIKAYPDLLIDYRKNILIESISISSSQKKEYNKLIYELQ